MIGPKNLDELHEMASRPTEGVLKALQSLEGDVLVLGAGGKMGFHLSLMIRRALDAIGSEHRVIAVSRFGDEGVARAFTDQNIPVVAADLLQQGAVPELPDAAAVFFLAGVKFGTHAEPEKLRHVNVALPAKVAKRFCDSPIVALSTGCVYAFEEADSGGSVETDELGGIGEYAESCKGRERSFAESDARVSLIRLNYSVDLRYGVLVDIAKKVLEGQPIDLSTGYFNIIWQGDANAYIVQSLAHAANPPFVLNVTGQQTLSVRTIANEFARRFDRPANLVGEESGTAWLSNAGRCHSLFGNPVVSECLLMDWVADWLLRGGDTLGKPTHYEVRDGRY